MELAAMLADEYKVPARQQAPNVIYDQNRQPSKFKY